MAFYIDCIHTDICEQSVITCWLSAIEMLITQIQAHSPQNSQTYMKTAEEEKKEMFVLKSSLSYAPSDDRCVTACVTRRREGAPEFK